MPKRQQYKTTSFSFIGFVFEQSAAPTSELLLCVIETIQKAWVLHSLLVFVKSRRMKTPFLYVCLRQFFSKNIIKKDSANINEYFKFRKLFCNNSSIQSIIHCICGDQPGFLVKRSHTLTGH